MIKYLIIGSAPCIVAWYALNGKKFLDKGYKLIALNNAWKIDPKNLHIWCHSTDYYTVGKLAPQSDEEKEIFDKVERLQVGVFGKYDYVRQGSGVMLLNLLTGLINRALIKRIPIEVCLAGCDCIYNGKATHFYEGGTPDPIRFGEDYLKGELDRIWGFYLREKFPIYNVGGQEKTLLPFPRKEI
jgi:hypothetical protein